ncbi:MAG: hypothetical protein EBZ59_09140 [Planctomycetia bacterium]|nr:hypothetical protein [Planctomycetia bacterium]
MDPVPSVHWLPAAPGPLPARMPHDEARTERRLECADPDEDEDLGDEEDLSVAQPLADEESDFDDFDDEFDDDFEEEENDPDWDHPDEVDSDEMPPGKGPGKKK